jgi:hypothetical protein
LFEHDLFGKPVSTFPDHAQSKTGTNMRKHGKDRAAPAMLLFLPERVAIRAIK